MTRAASGYWRIIDPQNGYVAMGPRALKELDFDSLADGFMFENDLLINLNILNLRVKDIPIPSVYGAEVSSMKLFKIIPTFTIFLTKGFFRRLFYKYIVRGFHPVALFLLFGFLLFGWGFVFGILTWIHTLRSHVPATTGTVMLSVLPFLTGFQLLLWAFVLDIQEEPK